MAFETILDGILDSRTKVRIIRLFVSRTEAFAASGREVAKWTALSPPAAHAALKTLLDRKVLKREILGKQHLYSLDRSGRIVRNILIPAFRREGALKEDIRNFLFRRIGDAEAEGFIVSLILYGSLALGKTHEASDCDIAVVVMHTKAKERLEKLFQDGITDEFYSEFGIHLDPYVQTIKEFRKKMKNMRPPISTLMLGYEIILGKDPIEIG
jgi:predicted nucleotidyltransferase